MANSVETETISLTETSITAVLHDSDCFAHTKGEPHAVKAPEHKLRFHPDMQETEGDTGR